MKPTPQQLKKLERLAKVLDNGDVELLTQLDELETKTEAELNEVMQVVRQALAVAEQTKKLQGEKGEKGDKGDKGEDGVDGVDGKNGLDGKNGRDGARGEKGEAGLDGINGLDGKDGQDGADGFVDEATVAYLEEEIKRLEALLQTKAGRGSMLGLDAVNRAIDQKVYVSDTAPQDPRLNDVWIDTNAYTYRAVTGTYTITATDYLLDCDGTFTITLPTAVGFTGEYIIKNSSNGIITLDTTSSQTIDSLAFVLVNQYDSIVVRSNANNWIIV